MLPVLLIVDDDPLIQDALGNFFDDDFDVVVATRVSEVKSVMMQKKPAFALVDLGLPPTPHQPTEGFAAIAAVKAAAPTCAVVVVSGQDACRHAQRARALGADDYAEKPCPPQTLKEKLMQAKQAAAANRQEFGLIGKSPPLCALREQIRLIAPVSFPVLIRGESGSGKEVVARALHRAAADKNNEQPFMVVNCAAIPEQLVEPTLFGHAKGAFTGAAAAANGYLGDAANGTLFLDEVGDLPAAMQPKLLRALETGEYQRVGETKMRQFSARIIAALNPSSQRRQRIRDDLYYRLSVLSLIAPPLRTMEEDRFLLLRHFRDGVAADLSSPPFTLSETAELLWRRYTFPGNVRELKNIVARLQVKYAGQSVKENMLLPEMSDGDIAADITDDRRRLVEYNPDTEEDTHRLTQIASRLGRDYAKTVLVANCHNAAKTAAQLNIGEDDLRQLTHPQKP